MVAKKTDYVLIESLDHSVKVNGYDTYLCPWSDFDDFMVAPMESLKSGQVWRVQLTVLEMTDDEYEAYCLEHELDVTGDSAF